MAGEIVRRVPREYSRRAEGELTEGNRASLSDTDFRRERALLHPSVFFWSEGEPDTWPVSTDLIGQEAWRLLDVLGEDEHWQAGDLSAGG